MVVALGIQHAMCMCHIVICHLPGSTTFLHFILWTAQLKKVIELKMCVLIFSTIFVWNISHPKKKWARYNKKVYIRLHVKYPLFLSDFNENLIFLTHFRQVLKYQISWISIQWSQVVSCRWMDRQMSGQKGRQTLWS